MIVSSTSTAPLLLLGSGGGGGGINEGGSSNCNFIFCLLKIGGGEETWNSYLMS